MMCKSKKNVIFSTIITAVVLLTALWLGLLPYVWIYRHIKRIEGKLEAIDQRVQQVWELVR